MQQVFNAKQTVVTPFDFNAFSLVSSQQSTLSRFSKLSLAAQSSELAAKWECRGIGKCRKSGEATKIYFPTK